MPLSREEIFDDRFFEMFPELADQIRPVAEEIFDVRPLSDAERAEAGGLEARQQRLPILPIGEDTPSTRIPGNPYSFDVSPVSEGLRDVAFALINRERQKRLYGDPEQAERLRGQAKAARTEGERTTGGADSRFRARQALKEASQLSEQAEAAEGVVPRLRRLREREVRAEEGRQAAQDFTSQLASSIGARQFDRDTQKGLMGERQKFREDFEKIRQKNRVELENLRFSNDKLLDGLTGDNVPASWPNSVARLGTKTAESLHRQADAIDESLNDPFQDFDETKEKRLKKERDQKRKMAYNFMSVAGEAFRSNELGSVVEKYQDLVKSLDELGGVAEDAGGATGADEDLVTKQEVEEYSEATGKSLEQARRELEEAARQLEGQ